jgi:hypothetical protein
MPSRLFATALALAACGGGGDGSSATTVQYRQYGWLDSGSSTTTGFAGAGYGPPAPTLTGNIAIDGFNWLNYRRAQVGMSALARNNLLDRGPGPLRLPAHQQHHDPRPDPGQARASPAPRLEPACMTAAGYTLFNATRALWRSHLRHHQRLGLQYMAEELITAIYHRFVIFEPVFKEIGTGAATGSAGYNYFTANFAANNGYSAGLASGALAVWPFNGQTDVPYHFFSDQRTGSGAQPNEVGYPISVHANLTRS